MSGPSFVKTIIRKTFSQRFFLSRFTRYPVLGRLIEIRIDSPDRISAAIGRQEGLVDVT